MSTTVHHHLSNEERVSIAAAPSQNGGPGFLVSLDAGESQLTVFMTREQLVALAAVTSAALSRPRVPPIGASNGKRTD